MLDIPGRLARGNWTAALFIDEDASIQAVKALTRIFTGRAGGSTGLLKILVGSFLGVRTERSSTGQGDTRIFEIPKIIEGMVSPVRGKQRRERRDPQQRVLDRPGRHRSRAPRPRACARSAATGTSPAARPSCAARLGQG